jgi:hypothetical protein
MVVKDLVLLPLFLGEILLILRLDWTWKRKVIKSISTTVLWLLQILQKHCVDWAICILLGMMTKFTKADILEGKDTFLEYAIDKVGKP